jgi:hypothetical protein
MRSKRINKEPLEEKNICFKPVLIRRDTVAPRRR